MFAVIIFYCTCLFDFLKKNISLVVFILSLQQMQDLQSQLDSEKKRSKDLASQIVKLNGIIKTGQDAIHQEQELVTKLKQQLEEREKVKQGSGEMGGGGVSNNQSMGQHIREREKVLEKGCNCKYYQQRMEIRGDKGSIDRITVSRSTVSVERAGLDTNLNTIVACRATRFYFLLALSKN